NMVAGTLAANLGVGEALSAGNTVTGISVAGGLQPGEYTIIAGAAPNTLELQYNGTTIGTATLSDLAGSGALNIVFTNGTDTVATISINAAAAYTAADQIADLTAAGNNSIRLEVSPSTFYGNLVSILGADVNRAQGLEQSSGLLFEHVDLLRQSV